MTNTRLLYRGLARWLCCLVCFSLAFSVVSARTSFTAEICTLSAPPQIDYYCLPSDSLYYSNDFTTSISPAQIVREIEPVAQDVLHDMHDVSWEQYKVVSLYIRALLADGQIGTANRLFKEFYTAAATNADKAVFVYATKLLGDMCYMDDMLPEATALYIRALKQLDKVPGKQNKYIELFADIHFALLDIRLEKYSWTDMQRIYEHLNALEYSLNKLPVAYRKSFYFIKTRLALEQIDREQAKKQLDHLGRSLQESRHPLMAYYFPFLKARYYSLINDSIGAVDNLHKALQAYNELSVSVLQQKQFTHNFQQILQRAHANSETTSLLFDVFQKTNHSISPSAKEALTNIVTEYEKDLNHFESQQFKQNYTRKFLIWAVVVLVLVIAVLLFWLEQKKKLSTLQKALESETHRAQQAQVHKSQFISNMSHEIRTPLNAIVGFSDLITHDDISDKELKENATLILANAERLLHQIDEMIDLAILESSECTFLSKSTSVMSMCTHVVDRLNSDVKRLIKIDLKSSVPELHIMTDPKRFQQAIRYILDNASTYTKTGTILFTVDLLDSSTLQCSITDTGVSVSEGKEENLFTHDEPIGAPRQSAGLGLLIARKIIEHLGGHLVLDTTYTKGARFVFTHPV